MLHIPSMLRPYFLTLLLVRSILDEGDSDERGEVLGRIYASLESEKLATSEVLSLDAHTILY